MQNTRKADRNAKIGQDVKQATKMKVDRKNDQDKQLQKLQKVGAEAKKAEKQARSLKSLVERQEKERKSTEKTVKDCEKIGKWVEKLIKELHGSKETEKAIASEVKVFRSTSKSVDAIDGLAPFLMAVIALVLTIQQCCAKASKK